ncbi:unnamed protein product [Ectocarpus sp. CCAP 1310/34]|nr:unnamed protein product [Ectocarpus sp. CCAP 1310/34]
MKGLQNELEYKGSLASPMKRPQI